MLPVRFSVKPALPALTLAGEMAAREGMGLTIFRLTLFDRQPPSASFKTLNVAVPVCAKSVLLSWTPTCVPLINVDGRLFPLKNTCESLKKLLPVKVTVWAGLPAAIVEGEMLLRIGILDEPCTIGLRMVYMV